MGTIWIYIVGPLVGALVAGLVYRLVDTDWSAHVKRDECGEVVLDECCRPIHEKCVPMVDACGNARLDDCGKKMMQTIVVHPHQHGFIQETPMMAAGAWMTERGVSPLYLQEQAQKVMPTGVVTQQTVTQVTSRLPSLPRTPMTQAF